MKPIFPWMGGKRKLAKELLPMFPEHTTYVEVFSGAAALYFMKEPSDVEVINDINGELTNLYRVIKHHPDELLRQFKWTLVSRSEFDWHKASVPATLTDIQRAARFYFLQKTAFGGKVTGQNFGTGVTRAPGLNLFRIEEDLSNAHQRLSRTWVENMDWVKCIQKYDRDTTLFYLDPPYFETSGYGVEFPLEQYQAIAELAKSCKGKMIISINDAPEMRDVFAGLNISTTTINYTVGGSGKSKERARELIIKNW